MAFKVGRVSYDSTPGCVTWTIEDFFSHPQDRDGYCIRSHTFSALGSGWYLTIRPFCSIFGYCRTRLTLMKDPVYPPVAACCEFGIRGRNGAELITYSEKDVLKKNTESLRVIELPTQWRMDRERFVPGDVLSVFCRIRKEGESRRPSATPGIDTSTQTDCFGQVSQDCEDGPSKCSNTPGLAALKVVENLKELLSNEEACDVTLKVQNQEFRAHKALLVARSSVFRAMFCHDMLEKQNNEVDITDCDPDAFRIFLKHVYTGDAEVLSASNAFDVFSVADKYDAPELKIQCKDCISSNITVLNVCQVIAFSLLHGESILLEKASQFFIKHFGQILLTNEWQCFLRDHTTAANELLIRASKFHVPPE